MSTAPLRMRCHWSWRSPSERPLCCTATRSPKTSRNTAATAGVSAISGTSTSTVAAAPPAPRPPCGGTAPSCRCRSRRAAAPRGTRTPRPRAPQPGERVGLFGRQRPAARARSLADATGCPRPAPPPTTNGSRSLRSSRTDTRPRRASRFTVSAPTPRSFSTRAGRPCGRAVQRRERADLLLAERASAARRSLLAHRACRHARSASSCPSTLSETTRTVRNADALPFIACARRDQPVAQQPADDRVEAAAARHRPPRSTRAA